MTFVSLPCLIALDLQFNGISESGHPSLVPIHKGSIWSFTDKFHVSCNFSIDALYQVEGVSFYS